MTEHYETETVTNLSGVEVTIPAGFANVFHQADWHAHHGSKPYPADAPWAVADAVARACDVPAVAIWPPVHYRDGALQTPETFIEARYAELKAQPGYDYQRWAETLRAVMLLHRWSIGRDGCVSCGNGSDDYGPDDDVLTTHFTAAAYPCQTMRVLLVQYDDHPDYDPRWRP